MQCQAKFKPVSLFAVMLFALLGGRRGKEEEGGGRVLKWFSLMCLGGCFSVCVYISIKPAIWYVYMFVRTYMHAYAHAMNV